MVSQKEKFLVFSDTNFEIGLFDLSTALWRSWSVFQWVGVPPGLWYSGFITINFVQLSITLVKISLKENGSFITLERSWFSFLSDVNDFKILLGWSMTGRLLSTSSIVIDWMLLIDWSNKLVELFSMVESDVMLAVDWSTRIESRVWLDRAISSSSSSFLSEKILSSATCSSCCLRTVSSRLACWLSLLSPALSKCVV